MMLRAFIWWLPGWMHELILRLSGWRVVQVADGRGVTSLIWSRGYPMPVVWDLEELAWEVFMRLPLQVHAVQWWGERIEGFESKTLDDELRLAVPVADGYMLARPGDWLVWVDGQMWVCEEAWFGRLYQRMVAGDLEEVVD